MKRTVLSILAFAFFGAGVNAQNVNIPDANFKAYLVGNSLINTNADSEISVNEASSFSGSITCDGLSIADLTGIEAFTGIIVLNASNNQLTSLDLSANTGLSQSVSLNDNYLTSLIMPVSPSVTALFVNNNPTLTSIDVSGLPNLDVLMLIWDNVTTLDVSNNTLLTTLNLGGNAFTSLDLTGLTNLVNLAVQETGLLSLDVSPCPSLSNLYAPNMADITELNMANGNNLSFGPSAFDVTNAPNLTCITVDNVTFSNQVWTAYVDPETTFSLNCSVATILATSITVQGQGGVSIITVDAGTLQMEAAILPVNATSQTVVWNVINGTGSATINPTTGILTALTNGIVTVGAMATDGSGVFGMTDITISNQTAGINDLNATRMKIYPNPAKNKLNIDMNELIEEISIFDLFGSLVQTETSPSFSIENLSNGVYLMNIKTSEGIVRSRFIKE